LSQDHQTQVLTAVERAKQITMTELNAVIGQQRPDFPRLLQQMQHAQQVPGGHAPPLPLGMQHPGLGGPGGGPAGAPLALTNAPSQHPLAMLKNELHRPEDSKSNLNVPDERHVSMPAARTPHGDCRLRAFPSSISVRIIFFSLQRSSISPPQSEREKYRSRTPESHHELKKVKKEEKDGHVSFIFQLVSYSNSSIATILSPSSSLTVRSPTKT
jgi:groucho